ncbi:beta-ketoacyl-[acyl-carrier-protein] synthase family protein [Streptomyces sp. JJ36]|uniref:beta-ketoacyl-[acyl-carrier-protein] synthase family protein n=1 Tax=Streptomyces sp. JJ36 TaxID=2736645 RepID=UPI0023516132|nr:beta-ketoacyl-[acyl-carrier-protein] synthase family protein [Streptomyces sp. JJ36]MCF6524487.1 beta-ketoacyl-[acyl-carrier-protein] synthase family protein [Streptomyces sp. JJ36]
MTATPAQEAAGRAAPGEEPEGTADVTRDGTRRRRVVVTGLGVVSAIGTGAEEFWAAARAGRSGTGEVTLFDTGDCLTHRGGEIRDWTPPVPDAAYGLGPLTRSESFALAATRLALEHAGLLPAGGPALPGGPLRAYAPERIGTAFGVVVGNRPGMEGPLRAWRAAAAGSGPGAPAPGGTTGPGAPGGTGGATGTGGVTAHLPQRINGLPAQVFALHGPGLLLATACAAGNSALAHAADAVADGRADAMVAGGADELSEAMFLMFNSFRALAPKAVQPFGTDRAGLMLGEGAGVLLLEAEECARARGATVLAELAGYGSYADAHHMTAPHPEGLGAVRSVRAALEAAGLTPSDIDMVSAHGTGTPSNDAAEARALAEVFAGRSREPVPVTALKSLLGHAQGAAGAIAAVACVLAVRDGVVPPTAHVTEPDPGCLPPETRLVRGAEHRTPVRAALNNAFGFGGNNCCTVITAPAQRPGPAGAGRTTADRSGGGGRGGREGAER